MGEERGDEDGIEILAEGKVLRAHRRDHTLHAEALLLETDAIGVDVGDPEAIGRDLPDEESGDPAVSAGEVQDLSDPAQIAETPAKHLEQSVGDAQARAEVGEERAVPVSLQTVDEKSEHLVASVDREVEAARLDLPVVQKGAQQRAGLVGSMRQAHGSGEYVRGRAGV